MSYEIAAVREALRRDAPGAIAQWEADYHRQTAAAAADILAHRDESPVVLLSGPSGSSKTTTAARIQEQLHRLGARSHLISMDNYFLSRSDPDFPQLPDGTPDLESPECLDIPLLEKHFARLETGGIIHVPIYDFPSHGRLRHRSLRMDASRGDIFLFEGLHALNERFTRQHPKARRIFVSPEDSFTRDGQLFCDPIQLRLMRRMVRDYLFRGASARYSLELWQNVIDSEKRYVLPYAETAHCRIATTLGYELEVLKGFVEPLLRNLPTDVPCRDTVDGLVALLSQIEVLDPLLVPEDSILREFIGRQSHDTKG